MLPDDEPLPVVDDERLRVRVRLPVVPEPVRSVVPEFIWLPDEFMSLPVPLVELPVPALLYWLPEPVVEPVLFVLPTPVVEPPCDWYVPVEVPMLVPVPVVPVWLPVVPLL